MIRALFMSLLTIVVACESSPVLPVPPIALFEGARTASGVEAQRFEVKSAVRCGECHTEMEREWRSSAHAKASTSEYYLAMKPDRTDCDRCHSPFSDAPRASAALRNEGVTCDACHMARSATVSQSGGRIGFKLEGNIRFGLRCDAAKHYFHETACSELHEESNVCGSCHLYYRTVSPSVRLPVITEFEEWAASGSAANCQDCHMPGREGELANGWGARTGVAHHDMRVSGDPLLGSALSLAAGARHSGKVAKIDVRIKNSAAHRVPAGIPGRQLILRVSTHSSGNVELDRKEKVLTRLLVDETGLEVPFDRATRVDSDSRLAALKTRSELFELASENGAHLRVELLHRPFSPAIAQALGLRAEDPVLIEHVEMRIRRVNEE